MLWTDSVFVTTADLQRIDSEVIKVASEERDEIVLTGRNGLMRGAVEEAAIELQKMVISFGGYLGSGDLSPNHIAAVMNIGMGNAVRQKCTLSQVCVSGDSEDSWNVIKQWVVFWTLHIIYRDAFNRTVKDRYEGKMRYYKSEIQRRVTQGISALGIPLVISPLSAPAAFFERESGSWGTDNVSLVAGPGTLDAVSRDVVITYVDMSNQTLYVDSTHRGNAESNPSVRVSAAMTTGSVLHVDINSLQPPTGAQHPSQVLVCVISPLKATHWNVYVGVADGTLYLQNATPIPIDTKTYTLAADPLTTGPTSGFGQYFTRRLSLVPSRQRA